MFNSIRRRAASLTMGLLTALGARSQGKLAAEVTPAKPLESEAPKPTVRKKGTSKKRTVLSRRHSNADGVGKARRLLPKDVQQARIKEAHDKRAKRCSKRFMQALGAAVNYHPISQPNDVKRETVHPSFFPLGY